MRIALLGYGKMGKAIEQIAAEMGHQIVFKTSSSNYTKTDLSLADAAIEFSTPATALPNIKHCVDAGIPIVVGTTAWYDHFAEASAYVAKNQGGMFTATNFSIGVNLFWKMTAIAAEVMQSYAEYEPSIDEIHHTEKLDAPSGTAITTAETVIAHFNRKNNWVHLENGQGSVSNELELSINSFRKENVPGTHTLKFDSEIDTIELKHTAHNRKGFAVGAIKAAEFMAGRSGIYTMKDLLNL
jgi:4-hydroxy-tetrahydrodipicolinate reductase